MSAVDDGGHKHEIIIVRHGGGDHDDGHHGGVWKIAFADFMTAMMCFFLVMWLINAANEQTKAAVASYFNPVKLIDRNSSRKGLEDIGEGPNAVGTTAEQEMETDAPTGDQGPGEAGPSEKSNEIDNAAVEKLSDEQLFADPYAVLAEIAAETGTRQNVSDKGDGGVQLAGPASGAEGGESYRDPFAPDFWSQQVEPSETLDEERLEVDTRNTEPASPKPVEKAEVEAQPKAKPSDAPSKATKAEAEQIAQEIAKALGTSELDKGISVVATDRGVAISVTEELRFGMFEIGSALPRPELVRAMEKIGKVIGEHKGAIIVNGHTDGRVFRSKTYDNWRLSTARAHAAYYMIARSGLDEHRIVEVAGFADRKLKNTQDPLAAENRRIEILLETGG